MFWGVVFFFVLLVLFWGLSRLMPTLIKLEFLGLVFFSFTILLFNGFHQDNLFFLFFIVVLASESVMGLVLFVLYSRFWGKDNIDLIISSKF